MSRIVKYKLKYEEKSDYGKYKIGIKIYQPVTEDEYHRDILDVFIDDNKILHLYADIDDHRYGNEILERLQIRGIVTEMVDKYRNLKYEDDLPTLEEVDIDVDIPFNIDTMPEMLFDVERDITEEEIYGNFILLAKFTNFKNSTFHMNGKRVKLSGLLVFYDIIDDEVLYVLYDENKNRINNLAFSRNKEINPIEFIKPMRCYNPNICLEDTVELLKWHKTYMEIKNKLINECISNRLVCSFDYFGLSYYKKLGELRDERIRRNKINKSFDDCVLYDMCRDSMYLDYPILKDKIILGNGQDRLIHRFIDMYNKEEQIYGVPMLFNKDKNPIFVSRLSYRFSAPDVIVTLSGDVFIKCDKSIANTLKYVVEEGTKLNNPFRCLRVVSDDVKEEEITKDKAFSCNEMYVSIKDALNIDISENLIKDLDDEILQYVITNIKDVVNNSLNTVNYLSFKYNNL